MTENHPITPPLELVQKWKDECHKAHEPFLLHIANRAAQWGAEQAETNIERKLQGAADQELEACRQWLEINGAPRKLIDGILVARCRPEPPSLKEEALADFDWLVGRTLGRPEFDERSERILRALKSIPDPS